MWEAERSFFRLKACLWRQPSGSPSPAPVGEGAGG